MTFDKALTLTIGFLGAVALGVWLGPQIVHQQALTRDGPREPETPKAVTPTPPATATSRPASPAPRRSAPTRSPIPVIAPSAPELSKRLKPLLNSGTNVAIASEGFPDGEQFATVVHAARNIRAPFMVLKHRVLTEHKSLTAAIHESQPHVNAETEARRARAEAQADIKALRAGTIHTGTPTLKKP